MAVKIDKVIRRDGEAMSYIASYVLPFLAVPTGKLADGICLAVFLLVLVILYIHSDMLHVNPMLNLAGWHIYEVTTNTGETRALISRRRIKNGSVAKVMQVGEDIMMEGKP
ncbi:MAG: hypothetical protein K1X53_01155 [Candidatus Sumerlaeaceae bacterium]|nr:hypothetical protein [Candidatus Sumerlaeaceae bacterium]